MATRDGLVPPNEVIDGEAVGDECLAGYSTIPVCPDIRGLDLTPADLGAYNRERWERMSYENFQRIALLLLALTSIAAPCGREPEKGETGESPADTGDSATDTAVVDTAGETGGGETGDTATDTP